MITKSFLRALSSWRICPYQSKSFVDHDLPGIYSLCFLVWPGKRTKKQKNWKRPSNPPWLPLLTKDLPSVRKDLERPRQKNHFWRCKKREGLPVFWKKRPSHTRDGLRWVRINGLIQVQILIDNFHITGIQRSSRFTLGTLRHTQSQLDQISSLVTRVVFLYYNKHHFINILLLCKYSNEKYVLHLQFKPS